MSYYLYISKHCLNNKVTWTVSTYDRDNNMELITRDSFKLKRSALAYASGIAKQFPGTTIHNYPRF